MGDQITFSGSHLVDSPGNELAQAHEKPRRQRGRLQVVPWGWEKGGPLCEELLSYSFLRGGIGVVHQRRGGRVGVGQTWWELIMGILDSPRVKGIVR